MMLLPMILILFAGSCMTPCIPEPSEPFHWTGFVMRECALQGVPVSLAVELIRFESGGRPDAKGPVNADGSRDYGLFQLNDKYHTWFASQFYQGSESFDPMNPRHSAMVGIRYLRSLYRQFGNWEDALHAYNCGPARVQNGEVPESTRRYAKIILRRI